MSMYKPQEFSEIVGVSVNTIQYWDEKGKLVAHRSPSNRRYYTHKQYVDYVGESKKGQTIIYTRVSTSNQKDDLPIKWSFSNSLPTPEG